MITHPWNYILKVLHTPGIINKRKWLFMPDDIVEHNFQSLITWMNIIAHPW